MCDKYLCSQVVVTFESNIWHTNEVRMCECSRTYEYQRFVFRPNIYLPLVEMVRNNIGYHTGSHSLSSHTAGTEYLVEATTCTCMFQISNKLHVL